jgi:hypothetical protein
MPDPDSEPENYSIDDMMDRLRSRGGGSRDGEAKLVTREDGTQVYKMRKRKRRSHQPKKEKEKRQQRVRVLQVVAAVGLVAGVGLALLGSVVYLNTPGYHQAIAERVKIWTGAEPSISQFRVSPVSAGASSLELKWPDSSIVRSLKVNGVQADLRVPNLATGKWKGAEMLASNGGLLVLDRPVGPAAPAESARAGDCPFDFRYRVQGLGVLFGGESQPLMRLRDTEASLDILDAAATTANLRFEGGTMSLAGWTDFAIRFVSLQFEPGGLRLGNVRLGQPKDAPGEIELLNPDQKVLDLRDGSVAVAVRLHRMPLGFLMGEGFGNWLRAEIETAENGPDGSLLFRADAPADLGCRVPFQATASSESVSTGLPMFGVIAREVGEAWYQSPRFDHGFTGSFVREGARSALEELRMESRNRLIVTGKVAMDAAGTLDGTLELGLPDATVNEARAAFRNVFKRRDGGYSWATVRLSGPGRQPQDDLQKQIEAAATLAPAEGAGGNDALDEAFRELTSPEK